jgi:glycogenin glucosyltransferase
MTEFDSIIYLDIDTLVLGDISHLNELVADPLRTGFELAAVADNWCGKFAFHFNAGVLVLHPSSVVFKELIRTMSLPGNYHPQMAEQSFLNAFFQLRYLQLPLIYNVNLAMYPAYPDLWKKMQEDFKIVHFTIVKPFLNQSNSIYDVPLKLYNDVLDEYMKTTASNQVAIKCV